MANLIQSNAIQASSSVNSGVQSSKSSPSGSKESLELTDGTANFTSALASVGLDSEPDNQLLPENLLDPLTDKQPDSLANGNLLDGNDLPADETALWQALMLIQPDKLEKQQPILLQASILMQPEKNGLAYSSTPELQNIALLDSKNKDVLNPYLFKQDYFTTLSTQNKALGDSLPTGLAANNISMQLAGAQFLPDSNESLMANLTDQLQPIPSSNSTLSQSFAAVGLGSATQAAVTQTQMAPLNLGQNAWESNLGSRLQMMVGQNVQTAEIRLDPPELGALDIKIKITNDVASVNITSAHAQVRDALETAVPRLREMFAESGVSLGDVNVRQESFAQQQNSGDERGGFNQNTEIENNDELVSVSSKIINDSLLDIYA